MAATLTYGPGAVLSHMGAVAHWQLIPGAKGLDVTARKQARPRDRVPVHRLRIAEDEITVHHSVPVTTVVRTIFDLGASGRRPVERAMHEAEHRGLYDALTLEDLLVRYPKRKGSAVIREVLRDPRPGGTENDFEEDFFSFLLDRGFPVPRVNAWVQIAGTLIRPDVIFDDHRVIVELDGGTHFTKLGRRKDERRDAALQAARWSVMRVSSHAFYCTPGEVEVDLRRLLQSKLVTSTAI
jgi:very-short-patch-repair endonuclease